MGPGRALFSWRRLDFRCVLFDQSPRLAQMLCKVAGSRSDGGLGRGADRVMLMNPEQLQSSAVLAQRLRLDGNQPLRDCFGLT
jgi:hypothetical protein